MLALASGAGLIGLVVFSLLRAGEQARQQQFVESERTARQQAQALRRLLDDPTVLDLVPAAERFEATEDEVVVPEAVGWLAAAAAGPVDALLAAKLQAAQRAEFVAGDAALAAAAYAELLGERGPQGVARLPLAAAAAWQAHRAGDAVRCRDGLRALDAVFAAATPSRLRDPDFSRAAASALLLAAQCDGRLPAWAEVMLPAMATEQAGPLLLRLRERGVAVDELAARHREIAARRELLRRCQQLLGTTSGTAPDGRLWLQFAAAERTLPARSHGAWAEPHAFAARAAGKLEFDADQFVGTAQAPPGAEVVVAGLWHVVPTPPAEPPLLARPGAALAAVSTLALVFVGTALLGLRALRQQSAAVRERAEFVTVVTHELKTPLAAIRLLAEMFVERRVPAERTPEYHRLLAGESARLSMLIENVLDLGRMGRGERAYDLRPCDLAEVAREAALLFAPVAARDGVELRLAVADGPAMAHADRGALLQALLNVLDNARKYAADGRAIELRAAPAAAEFAIAVRDFGRGVAVDERESIFERFRRGSAHRHGSIPGVGLGLHLARTIARCHGGELLCRAPDDGGAGAEFVFALPLAADHTEAVRP